MGACQAWILLTADARRHFVGRSAVAQAMAGQACPTKTAIALQYKKFL